MPRRCLALLALVALPTAPLPAQGMADRAVRIEGFSWIVRDIPGFRVRFLKGSYPAQYQDSLLLRLPAALRRDRALLDAPASDDTIAVFFVESREQMGRLVGLPVTGFADTQERSVFLVTNPKWRAFERHELMHVVSNDAWGRPAAGNEWLVEGIAQMADGRCAGRRNDDVMLALVARHGWIPLDTMLTAFRQQNDLRAYLQAASFTDWLLRTAGLEAMRRAWSEGTTPETMFGIYPLATRYAQWQRDVTSRWVPEPGEVDRIEEHGCG